VVLRQVELFVPVRADDRRFAPEELSTLHPWAGSCTALAALSVYLLSNKQLPTEQRSVPLLRLRM
jgi:hypothetical protein